MKIMTRLAASALCLFAAAMVCAQEPQASGYEPLLDAARQAAQTAAGAPRRVKCLLKVARLQAELGQPDEARRTLEDARDAARGAGIMETHGRAISQAAEDVENAAEAGADPAFVRSRVKDLLAQAEKARESDDTARSRRSLESARQMLDDLTTPEDIGVFHARVALGFARTGDAESADAVLQGALETLPEANRITAAGIRRLAALVHAALRHPEKTAEIAGSIESSGERMRALLDAGRELWGRDGDADRELALAALEQDGLSALRKLQVLSNTAMDWGTDAPADLRRLIGREARTLAAQAADQDTARRRLLDVYRGFGLWDPALRVARQAGDEAAVCRIKARQAVDLAEGGQTGSARSVLQSLDPEQVTMLGPELINRLGQAYAGVLPDLEHDTISRIQPETLRDAVLAAAAHILARRGECERAIDLAAAMSWDPMRPTGARQDQLATVAVSCLRGAEPADMDIALVAADRAVTLMREKNDIAGGQLDVHYQAGLALLEAGRTDAARQRAEALLEATARFNSREYRAIGYALTAGLLTRLGEQQRPRRLAAATMQMVSGIGCGMCIRHVFDEALPVLLTPGSSGLMENALRRTDQRRALGMARRYCAQYALHTPDLSGAQRMAALNLALLAGTRLQFGADRCEALLETIRDYRRAGLAPDRRAIRMVEEAEPPRPAPEEAASQMPERGDEQTTHLVVFTVDHCPDCARVKQLLQNYREDGRVNLDITYYSLDKPESLQLNERLCRAYGLPPTETGTAPAVFTALDALVGVGIDDESLNTLIESSRGLPNPTARLEADSGPVQPEGQEFLGAPMGPRPSAPGRALLTLFSKQGCSRCLEAADAIEQARDRLEGIDLDVRTYYLDTATGKELNMAYLRARGIEGKIIAPALFSAQEVLINTEITPEAVQTMAAKAAGEPAPEVFYDVDPAAARREIRERYEDLSIGLVVLAGLADGIFNPCAITVIIFFIAYLTHLGQSRRQILLAGIIFVGAVFFTYLAMGIGLQRLFAWGAGLSRVLSLAIMLVAGVAMLIAALLSFRDAWRAREGRLKEMSLSLPERFQSFIRRHISRRARAGLTLWAMALLGILVALVELPCTGLMYLPVLWAISWAAEVGGYGVSPYLWILLYNLAFILPLAAVFAAVYFGVTSEQLTRVFRRHVFAAKIVLGIVFLLLAALLLALPHLDWQPVSPVGSGTANATKDAQTG